MWISPVWAGGGGVRELLVVSFPMVLSQVSAVLNMFFDRWFLSKYDIEYHMSAAQTGGVVWWLIQMLPMGIVSYLGAFVAQYHGARRDDRIGACVWQATWLAIAGGLASLALVPFMGWFFASIHGDAKLVALETAYCRILSVGAVPLLMNCALSFFFAGRGKTWWVMGVSFLTTIANIALNRWWIFDPPAWLPFVEPGLSGAAWATATSLALGTVVYALLVFTEANERLFRVRSSWRLDWPLMKRMVRYGFPQSVHFMVDVGAFTYFLLILGRVDHVALTASTVAFSINHFLFVPLIGISQAVGVVVGKHIGAGRPDRGEASVCSAFILTMGIVVVSAALYLGFPDAFIDLFVHEDQRAALVGAVRDMARVFLAFVAIYSFFDGMSLIYAGALKGAGDTKFVMKLSLVASTLCMIAPCSVAAWQGWPAWTLWLSASSFIATVGVASMLRYRAGHWMAMKVIEHDLVAEVEAEEPHPVQA